jgi:hypothetical protein
MSAALAQAKRELSEHLDPELSHPSTWAPFVLTGDPDGALRLTARAWHETRFLWPACGLTLSVVLVFGTLARRRSSSPRCDF